MKKYIRDRKGKVVQCLSNIAQMNVLEYQYCNLRYWGFYRKTWAGVVELLLASLWGAVALVLLAGMLLYLVFPIVDMAVAWRRIRSCRKTIEFLKRESSIVQASEWVPEHNHEVVIKRCAEHDRNYHPENEKGASHERND